MLTFLVESPVRDTWDRRKGTSDTLGVLLRSIHPGWEWVVESGSLFSRTKLGEGHSEGYS